MAESYDPNDLFSGGPQAAQPQPHAAGQQGADYDPNKLFTPAEPPPEPTGDGSEITNFAKALPGGLVKGAIQGIGTPGTIREAASGATDWVGEKLGVGKDRLQEVKDITSKAVGLTPFSAFAKAPSGNELQKQFDENIGKLPEAQGSGGKYGEAVGEFMGNPLSYLGPGSVGAKAISNVGSALTSEFLGQKLDDWGLGGLGRLTGAVLGGHLSQQRLNKGIMQRNHAMNEPENLRAAADGLYGNLRSSGVEVKPQAMAILRRSIESDLNTVGMRHYDEFTKPVYQRLAELTERFSPRGMADFDAIDSTRQSIKMLMGSRNPETRKAARMAVDAIDEFTTSLNRYPALVGAGHANLQRFATDMTEARKNWASLKRNNTLENAIDDAMIKTGTSGAGGNLENNMRREIKRIVMSPRLRAGFSKDEISQMRSIVEGDKFGDALRWAGKFAATGIVSGTLGLAIGEKLFGGLKSLGVPVAGWVAKHAGEERTLRNIKNLAAETRARGSAAPALEKTAINPSYMIPAIERSTESPNEPYSGNYRYGPNIRINGQ